MTVAGPCSCYRHVGRLRLRSERRSAGPGFGARDREKRRATAALRTPDARRRARREAATATQGHFLRRTACQVRFSGGGVRQAEVRRTLGMLGGTWGCSRSTVAFAESQTALSAERLLDRCAGRPRGSYARSLRGPDGPPRGVVDRCFAAGRRRALERSLRAVGGEPGRRAF